MDATALLAKIEEVKADFAAKLDEIAAAAQGEEQGEPAPEGEMPAAEVEAPAEEPMAPEAPPAEGEMPAPAGKMPFTKKKPGGDLRKALGI